MSEKINPEYVTLIYIDTDNEKHTQPVNDLVEAGTMMNPDTGEEYALDSVRILETVHESENVAIVYVDENGNEHVQGVTDAVFTGTLTSPDTGEEMSIDHVLVQN